MIIRLGLQYIFSGFFNRARHKSKTSSIFPKALKKIYPECKRNAVKTVKRQKLNLFRSQMFVVGETHWYTYVSVALFLQFENKCFCVFRGCVMKRQYRSYRLANVIIVLTPKGCLFQKWCARVIKLHSNFMSFHFVHGLIPWERILLSRLLHIHLSKVLVLSGSVIGLQWNSDRFLEDMGGMSMIVLQVYCHRR